MYDSCGPVSGAMGCGVVVLVVDEGSVVDVDDVLEVG